MKKTEREIELAALELRGKVVELVRAFEEANGVVVTEVTVSRVAVRQMGSISGPAVLDCSVFYVSAPAAS